MNWLRLYLPLYLAVYLFTAFVWPSYRTYRRTGINPLTFGSADDAHDYIGAIMKLLIGLLVVVVLLYSLSGAGYSYLVPVSYMQHDVFRITGFVLIHVSLAWICVAQFQMGNSWRIGIDEQNKSPLVTDGIFSISRNPVFMGMIVSMLGILLMLPNILTFFLAFTSYIILQIQIRLEEAFLEKLHGADYQWYRARTRRLL